MAVRRSTTSTKAPPRVGRRGPIVWLTLGWLIFIAWLALLGWNTTPYLGGRPLPPASDLSGRLIALPAALPLPAALATPAAWTIAALALFIGVVTIILTFSPGPRAATIASAPAIKPVRPPAPEPAPAVLAPPPLAGEGAGGRGPRVFISHSSGNNDFGQKLERELKQTLGDDAIFYDSDGGLIGGDLWPEQLQLELGQRDVFVLILSPRAAQSAWVRKEWNYALMQATSIGGKVIVPVMYEETPLWPFLADIQVIDFKDPARFAAAFADLLVAVRLGRSRQAALAGLRGVRRGPPFDADKLPLVDRFIGRDADITWALERLAPDLSLTDRRVVDIGNGRLGSGMASIAAANGLAGIGKSALAGALARMLYATDRYPDGIAVVACNEITDPAAILRAALARFDSEEKEPPEQTIEQLSGLARRVFAQAPRALVILDNIEPQLASAAVTQPLRVAGAALLLTSRQRLPASAVPAADSRELGLLSLDEAVDVFIENRQRESQPAEAAPSDADRAAIVDIVTALDRHTLAVKLAAPRSRGRDLARLARDYAADPRLGLNLRDGTEAVDVVMSSSVSSLPVHARQLFAALGAFASLDIGRDALLAVDAALGDPASAASLDALLDLRLADAALDATLPDSADRERLRLHPLTRAFARDLLDGVRTVAGDPPWPAERRAQAERAVAAWYANYADNADTPDEGLLPDEANIGGALAWAAAAGDDRLLARLANGMQGFWETRSRTETRLAYLPLAVEAARRVAATSDTCDDYLLAARLELAHGSLLQMVGDLPGARLLIERSLEARVKYDDLRGEGVARSLLGDLARQEGDLPTARAAYSRYLEIMQQVGDLREEGVALIKMAQVSEHLGDLPQADGLYHQALDIIGRVNFPPDIADTQLLLGRFLIQHGRGFEEGRDMLRQAEEIYTKLGPAWAWQAEMARSLLDQLDQPSGGEEE